MYVPYNLVVIHSLLNEDSFFAISMLRFFCFLFVAALCFFRLLSFCLPLFGKLNIYSLIPILSPLSPSLFYTFFIKVNILTDCITPSCPPGSPRLVTHSGRAGSRERVSLSGVAAS